jgi:hypothetical protein
MDWRCGSSTCFARMKPKGQTPVHRKKEGRKERRKDRKET